MTPAPLPAHGLLFDLEGTLVDTAPDIAAAANHPLITLGLQQRPLIDLRRWIGHGSIRLMKRALTGEWDDKPEPALLEQTDAIFFEEYAKRLWDQSRLFSGQVGMRLGCVTNKPS